MPKYVIERTLPGAGRLTPAELRGIAQNLNSVIRELGAADLQWVESFVVDDKIYCVYNAKNPERSSRSTADAAAFRSIAFQPSGPSSIPTPGIKQPRQRERGLGLRKFRIARYVGSTDIVRASAAHENRPIELRRGSCRRSRCWC